MLSSYKVVPIRSKKLTSNCYLVEDNLSNDTCVFDIGDWNSVRNHLRKNQKITNLFLTHYHYDHIRGINELLSKYPNCRIFTNSFGHDGLRSSKINLSYYHEDPVTYHGSNIIILDSDCEILIFKNIIAMVYQTPGHNPSCLSIHLKPYIFTGDSYIPFTKVVTKLPGGDKSSSRKSLLKLRELCTERTIICPGHGEMIKFYDTDLYGNIDSLV